MTNEDRQRAMEFIIEQQAWMAGHLQQLEEERIRDRPRMARLEKSFQQLVELAQTVDSRLDTSESKLDTSESKIDRLESIAAAQDSRLAVLEECLQRLIRIAEVTESRLARLEAT